jgi:hypothetical protein
MKQINWSPEKNEFLKATRSVCFEDVIAAIDGGGLLDDIEHINAQKYQHQRMLVVLMNGYVYGVPYVFDAKEIFLKTVYPSRKLTALYLTDDENG